MPWELRISGKACLLSFFFNVFRGDKIKKKAAKSCLDIAFLPQLLVSFLYCGLSFGSWSMGLGGGNEYPGGEAYLSGIWGIGESYGIIDNFLCYFKLISSSSHAFAVTIV